MLIRLAAAGAIFAAAISISGTAWSQDLGPLVGDEPSYLDLGAGAFDILSTRHKLSGEGNAELRLGEKLFGIGPAAGLLVNGQGGVFAYAGIYADLRFAHFVFTPLVGLGAYSQGHSENLGGTFEFRLSAAFAYEFDDLSRLGLRFGHISNAGLQSMNPSDNEALATYSIPL